MKNSILIFFLINSITLFCQEKSIKEIVSEFNNTKLILKNDFKLSGNILNSKLECKNYFYKVNNDSICFIGLKNDNTFIVFLQIGNYDYIKKRFKSLNETKEISNGSIAPSKLLIYNIKKEEYYLVSSFGSGYSIYTKDEFEYNLYFDIITPITVFDKQLNPKYCFFDTEEDSDRNLAYCKFIFHEKYFQINTFAQKERKRIDIQKLKFSDLEEICTNETVLIKKEYFRYNKLDIFNIYEQKLNKQLILQFPIIEN